MKKSYKNDDFYTEIEVKKYFYGYCQGDLTGETYLGVGDRLTSEFRAPSGQSYGVSMLVKENEELLLYSIGGVEVLDIYTGIEDRSDCKRARREARKHLLN